MSAKTSVKSEIKIDAPKEKVWSIISDLGGVQNFHPGVKKSYYTSEHKEGLNASRVCELIPMGRVEESATEWQDGESFVLKVIPLEKAPPFAEAFGRMSVRHNGTGTIASLEVEYSLKYGLIGRLMDSLMIKKQFNKVVPAVLDGLKHYTETGEEVTMKTLKKVN